MSDNSTSKDQGDETSILSDRQASKRRMLAEARKRVEDFLGKEDDGPGEVETPLCSNKVPPPGS